jgi:haloalkane dehalogenase
MTRSLETRQVPGWLAAEYPFMPRLHRTPAGAHLSYVDEGPRQTHAVVMVHGNPTWSFYYRHVIARLSPHVRCIAPDHVGMGLSDKPQDYSYTLATRIADLESLIAALGLTSVDLLVHDWGGAIGMGFATRHPEMVRRIGILNTAAFTMDRIPARIALCRTPGIGPFLVRGFNAFAWPATWMTMHRRTLSSVEKRGYLLPYDSWRHRVAVSAFVQDIPMDASHPTWATLKSIEDRLPQLASCPIQIVWGGRDFCFNDAFLERWRKIYPAAAVHRIADAGHYVIEDAREEALAILAPFFGA